MAAKTLLDLPQEILEMILEKVIDEGPIYRLRLASNLREVCKTFKHLIDDGHLVRNALKHRHRYHDNIFFTSAEDENFITYYMPWYHRSSRTPLVDFRDVE